MKTVFIICSFTLFAFVVANADLIKKPGELNMTAKMKKKVNEITSKLPEPIVFSETNINPNENLNVILTGTIIGLTGLDVNDFKVSILGGISISSFEIVLPKLSVNITSYELDAKLGLTHVYGKGEIILDLENVVLNGSAKLGIQNNIAQITSIKAELALDQDSFNFKITGWLHNEDASAYITRIINNIVHNMKPEDKPTFNALISSVLTDLVADFKIPVSELTKP